MKYRFVKSIGKIFIFFLWLVLILILAEYAVRVYEYFVAKRNPLIFSLNNQPPWSYSEVVSGIESQSTKKLPPLDMSQWCSNRVEFFLQLSLIHI